MLEIAVNGETRWGQSGPENWGELLNSLESGEGSNRRVVTAVRFDGVAVPTFRDPETLDRALSDIARIEVETSTFDQLVHESARAAYDAIAPLQRAVARIAASFRTTNGARGWRELPSLTAALQGLTVVTAMLTTAGRRPSERRADFDNVASRLCGVLDRIVECQTQHDWQGIADTLQGGLAPALTHWAAVLLAIDGDRGDATRFGSLAIESRS